MMKYPYSKKKPATKQFDGVIGMLYVVNVRLVNRNTGEKIKHKILMVGCEVADIERKLSWIFDKNVFSEISITDTERVREKIHILSTVISQERTVTGAVVEAGERQIITNTNTQEKEVLKRFAVGLSTTVFASDETHAIRKTGNALINQAVGHSHSGSSLSEDSTLIVEELSKGSGYAKPRDVTNESNKATFVRG